MGYLSDLVDRGKSIAGNATDWVTDHAKEALAPIATVIPDAPWGDWTPKKAEPQAAVAAFPHYTDDEAVAKIKPSDAEKKKFLAAEKARADKLHAKVTDIEKAAASNDNKAIEASLDGMTESQRKTALEQMSPEARSAAEESLEKRKKKLELVAERLEKGRDSVGVVTNLTGLSPSEASELEKIYGEKFKDSDGKPRTLRGDLADSFDKGDKETEFISAVFSGDQKKADTLSTNLAIDYIEDEGDDVFQSESGVNKMLRARSKDPAQAKAFADAYFLRTGRPLTDVCGEVMDSDAEIKEANANMEGDRRRANVAVIEQDDDDRTTEVIEDAQLEPNGMDMLARDVDAHTGKKLTKVIRDAVPEEKAKDLAPKAALAEAKMTEERDEKLNVAYEDLKKDPTKFREADKKAEAVASRLLTELSKMHLVGNNTEVTDQLRGLSPAEMKLVMDHYARMKSTGMNQSGSLEDDLRAKLDGKDLKVASAALSGDNVRTAVALVQQAADNAGTNVDGWKKAMETLKTKEEREQFQTMMNEHVGTANAYKNLVKSETSSFDRDELLATSIADEDERAATMAQVRVSKNAYGGKLTQLKEGINDEIWDAKGVSDEKRAEVRAKLRKYDFQQWYSNAGGGEDDTLDAMSNLTPAQAKLFEKKMREQNGESAAETLDSELSGTHAESAKEFLAGHQEKGQAKRMVAELDNIVDDREDAASKPFEDVKLPSDIEARIAKLPPAEQKAARERELKTARGSLLAEADKAAQAKGYKSYMAMLESELSPAELAIAKERIESGKASDASSLFEAGDTVVGGVGKDTEKFYSVMQDKTPAEMAALKKDFEAKHPGVNFENWVRSKATSAGERRDFDMMLQGNFARMDAKDVDQMAKEKPELLIQRVKDLEAAARGGNGNPLDIKGYVGNKVGNLMADQVGNAGERLDNRLAAVEKIEAKLARGEALSDQDREDLVTHMRYMSGDQKAYTETKTEVANTSAEVVGTVVEVGTLAATGNEQVATLTGGLSKMDVKATLNGGRYSTDDMIADAASIAAETATGGDHFKNPIVSGAIEGAAGGAASALGNTKNWKDAGKLASEVGTQTTSQAMSGALSGGAEDMVGENVAGKIASATVEQVASGSSAPVGDQLLQIAKSAGRETLIDGAKNYHKKHHPTTETTKPEQKTETASEEEAIKPMPVIAVGDAPRNHDPIDVGALDFNQKRIPITPSPIIAVDGRPHVDDTKATRTPDQQAAMDLMYEARTPDELAVANEMLREQGLAPAQPDQLERNILVEKMRGCSDPNELAALRAQQLALDTQNVDGWGEAMRELIANITEADRPALVALLGDLHRDAEQTDGNGDVADKGIRDNVEEARLALLREQLGPLRIDENLIVRGIDPQEALALQELVRDHDFDMDTLSDEQRRLFLAVNAAGLGNMRVGGTLQKNIPLTDAPKYLNGTYDKIGGFVGPGAPESGGPGRAMQRTAVDYERSPFFAPTAPGRQRSELFGPEKERFVPGPEGGMYILTTPITEDIHDQLRVPLGTQSHEMVQQRAEELARQTPFENGRTEAVDELFQPDVDADGNPVRREDGSLVLPHLEVRNPTDPRDSFTGKGFAAVARARGLDGERMPVALNHEFRLAERQTIPLRSQLEYETTRRQWIANLGRAAEDMSLEDELEDKRTRADSE